MRDKVDSQISECLFHRNMPLAIRQSMDAVLPLSIGNAQASITCDLFAYNHRSAFVLHTHVYMCARDVGVITISMGRKVGNLHPQSSSRTFLYG